MTREQQIKEFGLEVVENDEELWYKRGYKIDYVKGLLVKI